MPRAVGVGLQDPRRGVLHRLLVKLRENEPRPAAIGTTRALLQGVEFEKWTGVVTDGKDDAGDGGNSGGGSDGDQGENPLG